MGARCSLGRGVPPVCATPDKERVNGSGVPVVRLLLRRLRAERGFTLVELLVTMAIMLIVISALVQMATSGNQAENELNLRFQAQEQARLGLDTFRREIHNACSATIAGGGTQITLMNNAQTGSFTCNVVGSNWCTTGSGQRYALYRQAAAGACGTGVMRADYLIAGAIFSLPTPAAGQLPKVTIDMTVNRQPTTGHLNYRLDDAVALRNARRA
jgi:prepilin-type N-terminal cleavage/methylation domain-containing protein